MYLSEENYTFIPYRAPKSTVASALIFEDFAIGPESFKKIGGGKLRYSLVGCVSCALLRSFY